MNDTTFAEIKFSDTKVGLPENPAKLLNLVERVPHWSGLKWYKKKVRAKYYRDHNKWKKEYFSLKNQQKLQEEKKNASKSTSKSQN